MLTILWWLIVGHFVADYPLQTDFIARGKSPSASPQIVPWYYLLTAHAMTHGAAVGLITGSDSLAVAETVYHFALDLGKCNGWYGIHVDQFGHIASKVLWAVLLYVGT